MIRRWISRAACAMLFGVALPASLAAQDAIPLPPGTAPQVPAPAAPMPPVVVTAPQALAPVPAVPAAVAIDPYHAATPYNPTVVGRTAPNPQWNRTNFTLPCDNPNQNFAPLQLTPHGCGRLGCGRLGRGGCGNGCGLFGGNGGCGIGAGAGACATCGNTANFAFGSSRSFFGESSREFFERPPSVDGIRHHAKRYAPANGTVPVGGYIVP
jgi:hypothetical protein